MTITPFMLDIPQSVLDDLRRRLDMVRWPDAETIDDWSQGAPLARVQALHRYWRDQYDWRRCEAMLNGLGQFKTKIDGLDIHFLHARSPHPGALPMLITHGWPGSVIEFAEAIPRLTDPTRYGGDAADAFHVIAPSLPGYGFSGKPAQRGWNLARIARAWAELPARLGYQNYVAQGGDWGSGVTHLLGELAPEGLLGVHVNFIFAVPPGAIDNPNEAERVALAAIQTYTQEGSAYAALQATRPQTIGYALADSPIGQAGWIYEKLAEWSDCNHDPETVFGLDAILDNIMLYWLSNSGASSARLYRESLNDFPTGRIELPFGHSAFPKEVFRTPRSWVEQRYPNIIHWNTLERGGHFAAFEQPELFVTEMQSCFRKLR